MRPFVLNKNFVYRVNDSSFVSSLDQDPKKVLSQESPIHKRNYQRPIKTAISIEKESVISDTTVIQIQQHTRNTTEVTRSRATALPVQSAHSALGRNIGKSLGSHHNIVCGTQEVESSQHNFQSEHLNNKVLRIKRKQKQTE
jgi:hypothetical protein